MCWGNSGHIDYHILLSILIGLALTLVTNAISCPSLAMSPKSNAANP
jgi:hypothetical protein